MSFVHTRHRQRGVSAWSIIGSLLVVAGMAGLGVALIMPGSQTPGIAPVATGGGTGAPLAGDTTPAAPGVGPTAVTKTDRPGSGPHPNWHGTWRGAVPDAQTVITADRVGACKWINATEPRFDSDCESGYAKASVSLADISRRYEESVAQFQRDPTDFKISDPIQSRRMISRIKPGNYRVIWMDGGSDCGREEMIVDGDLLLRIVDCKYQHEISLFTRERVTPSAAGQEPQVAASGMVAPPQPGGRWHGAVTQAGFPPYPAVMQLDPTAAGLPAGTMAYPTLGCTASLAFMRREGNAFWFRESILAGRGKCLDGGRISVSPMSNDTVAWRYFVGENVNSPMATGTFRR